MAKVGAIILAAGASSRFGAPKQLLRYQGQSLLRRTTEMALASGCDPMLVVLGAHLEKIRPELEGLPVQVAVNPDWEQGMGSSIRTGMLAMFATSEPPPDAVLFLLCDQPLLTTGHIGALIEARSRSSAPIIASEYEGVPGVPALFAPSLFSELAEMQGTEGAKRILRAYPDRITSIPFPGGRIDIDTIADYRSLNDL